MTNSIERIEAPSRKDFDAKYVRTGTPVVITGVVDRWPAVSRWADVPYVASLIGSHRVPVLVAPEGDFFDVATKHRREMEVREAIEAIAEERPGGPRYYLSEIFLRDVPGLLKDLEDPPYFAHGPERYFGPWLGRFGSHHGLLCRALFFGRDTCTPTHHHVYNQALVCVVSGTKRMKLFGPEQSSLLYPNPRRPWQSRVHPDRPDLDRFPRFARAKPLEVTLGPGDMLYIPVHWWHFVDSPGLSAAVTFLYAVDFRLWHFPNPGLVSLALTAGQGIYQSLRRDPRMAAARR